MTEMDRTVGVLAPGKIYRHRNAASGIFLCLRTDGTGAVAQLRNLVSGWTFWAHGCGFYQDGSIDWDYSTGGHFQRPGEAVR